MRTSFEAYVGIDWSGARAPGYAGIAIAECRAGRAAPRLIAPPGRRWTRSAVHDWLAARLVRGERLLVGLDFAFALPGPFTPPPTLWADIDAHCAAYEDYWGGAYAEASVHFWHRGLRPADWIEHQRPAELACIAAKLGRPQTPLKLIGARQVGKGALAGMRVLHALRSAHAARVAVWPFDAACDAPGVSVLVEMYPRLFIRDAGYGDAKLRTAADLNGALKALSSNAVRLQTFDDHEADALVSAAGLRLRAGEPALWEAGRGEALGWIFGVPKPG